MKRSRSDYIVMLVNYSRVVRMWVVRESYQVYYLCLRLVNVIFVKLYCYLMFILV